MCTARTSSFRRSPTTSICNGGFFSCGNLLKPVAPYCALVHGFGRTLLWLAPLFEEALSDGTGAAGSENGGPPGQGCRSAYDLSFATLGLGDRGSVRSFCGGVFPWASFNATSRLRRLGQAELETMTVYRCHSPRCFRLSRRTVTSWGGRS